MQTFSALLAICAGIHRSTMNSTHKGQWRRALLFSLISALNKRLSKQWWSWWFETLSRPLWRHCNGERFGNEVQGHQRIETRQRRWWFDTRTQWVSYCEYSFSSFHWAITVRIIYGIICIINCFVYRSRENDKLWRRQDTCKEPTSRLLQTLCVTSQQTPWQIASLQAKCIPQNLHIRLPRYCYLLWQSMGCSTHVCLGSGSESNLMDVVTQITWCTI